MKPTEALRGCEGNGKVLRLFRCSFNDKKWDSNITHTGYMVVETKSKNEEDLPDKADAHDKAKLKIMREKFKTKEKIKYKHLSWLDAQQQYIDLALQKCGIVVKPWIASKTFPPVH